jgi:hypothetical protein
VVPECFAVIAHHDGEPRRASGPAVEGGQQPPDLRIHVRDLTVRAGRGTGWPHRSLRWTNDTAMAVDDQKIRVRSAGCATTCGPEDTYRVRAYETTASVPRFNNAGSQVTVLLLENAGPDAITGTVYFWNNAGSQIAQQAFTVAPKALFAINTATVAPGVSGAITVTHNGAYGAMAGKAVALEPSTGFSFDSPLVLRAR